MTSILSNEGEGSREFARRIMAILGIVSGKPDKEVKKVRASGSKDRLTLMRGISQWREFDLLIREGFSVKSGDNLKETLNLTDNQLAETLGLSPKTLQRKRKSHERLSRVESDILYRTARIFAIAVEVIEDEERAKEWIHKPQFGLGGRVPFEMMQTEVGVREVENLLSRIEYGVYS